jgi:proline iminopeptidase
MALTVAGCVADEGSVPRDGFALHYTATGTATPIVFLSGGPGFKVDYMRPAADLFPPGYRFIFLQQRGTGRSRPARLNAENMTVHLLVEDLEALRVHLNVERLFLAGHSWGGMLAMAYAASYPDRVDRLILIASGGPTLEFYQWFGDNIAVRLRPEDKEARAYWDRAAKGGMDRDKAILEAIKVITPAYFFDRAKGLAFVSAVPDGTMHTDAQTLLNEDMQKQYDLRPGLRKLTRPVLIVQGHQDPIGDKTAEDIRKLISSSTLKYLRKCGHFPRIEQPEALRTVISEFLKAN